MSKVIPFFATKEDLNELMAKITQESEIIFTLSGVFETSSPIIYHAWKEVPDAACLILKKNTVVRSREIIRECGATVYAIDQRLNPDSLSLSPCRELSSRHMVAGSAGISTESEFAEALYGLFRKNTEKSFKKVKSYYVGLRALTVLTSGGRLSPTESSPQEYDLSTPYLPSRGV